MKKLLAVAVALGLGSVAMAGPILGMELVPHGGLAYPYFTVGYDAGYAIARFSTNSPLTLDAWYGISVEAGYPISTNLRFTPGLTVWGKATEFALVDGRWAFSVGANWKWSGLALFAKAHFPFQVYSNVPFFGMWLSFGVTFDPWHSSAE